MILTEKEQHKALAFGNVRGKFKDRQEGQCGWATACVGKTDGK